MNNQPIGFFDSGVGGLSIWREVVNLLSEESTIYFADQAFFPYGAKSQSTIQRRMEKICQFLINKQVKLIVIACNTATVSGIDFLRRKFNVPFVGVEPAIKPAIKLSKTGVVGVLATKRTILSQRQNELIKQFNQGKRVISIDGSDLTPLVEQGRIDFPETEKILKKLLLPLKKEKVDVFVLASTHYVFLKKQIQAIVSPEVKVIDSSQAVARQTKRFLNLIPIHDRFSIADPRFKKHLFFTSADSMRFQHLFSQLLGISIKATSLIL